MIRMIALLVALAVPHSALAQSAPAPAAQPKPAPKQAAPKAKSPAPKAEPQPAPAGPCLGVISHLKDFSVQRVGITVFGNELKEVPVPAWGLDELVIARVRAAAGPRFVVRKIAYSPAAFASIDNPEPRLFRDYQQELDRIVHTIAQGGGCERYVLVTQGGSAFATTNQSVKGVGIVNYGFQGIDMTVLFALTNIRVYDGRTLAVLKRGAGGGPLKPFSSFFAGGEIRGPNRRLTGFAWPPTPDVVVGLRDQARSLLAESLDQALPELLAP